MKVFSFTTDKGINQIGVEFEEVFYNFSQAWELYKELKNQGHGPSLNFLQLMVEADFLRVDTFQEVFTTLKELRPIKDLILNQPYRINSPIDRPQKILCVGRNYKAHADELGNEVPKEPLFFSKSPSALIAHQDKIRIPKNVGRVDFEGELAVIIGKKAYQISEKYAFDYIAGFSILNDVTARALQKADAKEGKPWFRAKSFDTFCPFGPYLVPKDAIKDYKNLELEVKVNGELKQQAYTSQMIHDLPEIVSYLSQYCTLLPGDIIATGTPSGVGSLKSGDIVECKISELGTLVNPVE